MPKINTTVCHLLRVVKNVLIREMVVFIRVNYNDFGPNSKVEQWI
jgi:hypothetical protein